MSIDFVLNGVDYRVPVGSKLLDLIEELELTGQALSILVNLKMVPRKLWRQELQSQDRVEICLSTPAHCGGTARRD